MPIPFRPIARLLTRTLRPTPHVNHTYAETLPAFLNQADPRQGVLVTVNHYSSPGFQAMWIATLISAILPLDIHWVMTTGWTNSGWLSGLTHWLFPHLAGLFGFTPMPAMPPDPADIEKRATAVRAVLKYARETPLPIIGLAPEGADTRDGILGPLPPGVGRFVHLLNHYCPLILPVGIWMEDGRVNLNCGELYPLELSNVQSAAERDHVVGQIIMQHIAQLLPENLGGNYVKKPEG
jgi:hypothetical protein